MKMKQLISTLIAIFALATVGYQTLMEPATADLPTATLDLAGDAAVHFLNVGQGDSTLFVSGSQAVLIDAGTSSSSAHIVEYLTDLGVTELTAAVATHPHADHIGAMDDILYEFPTETLYLPDYPANTQTYERMLDAVEATDTVMVIPAVGDQIVLDNGVTFTLLSPALDADYSDTNDYSLVYMVQIGDTRILMMGDAEAPVEADLLAQGYDLSCDVIKLGHHGSSSSSTTEFIAATGAEIGIISCGEVNEYGHPTQQTLRTLVAYNIEPVYTYAGDYVMTFAGT